jgi:hypothetical protein
MRLDRVRRRDSRRIWVVCSFLLFTLTFFMLIGSNVTEVHATPIEHEWTVETVQKSEVGYWTSIALDSSDTPHISYYDAEAEDLKYATPSGDLYNWAIDRVDYVGDIGMYTSIVIDSTDTPHISYHDHSGYDLRHAWAIGDDWGREVVDSVGPGTYTSIAIDSIGNLHISYMGNILSPLRYAMWDGNEWTIEDVDTAPFTGMYTSIAIDQFDRPHICYYDGGEMILKHAYRDVNNQWQIEIIDQQTGVGTDCSLAISEWGYFHVSYYDGDGGLRYAESMGGGWIIDYVDYGGDAGMYSSIAVDSTNHPHIIYYDRANGDLKHAKLDAGQWTIDTVDSDGDVGQYTSIAIDSYDRPHISYFDKSRGQPKYAVLYSTNWNIYEIEHYDEHGDVSFALDSNDNPHIIYRSYPQESPWESVLEYARRDGTSWTYETVDPDVYELYPSSLALDSRDNVQIVYMKNLAEYIGDYEPVLMFANKSVSTWVYQSVLPETTPVRGAVSFTVDSYDHPHICGIGPRFSSSGLKHISLGESGWQEQFIGYIYDVISGPTSIIVDDAGGLHVVYIERTDDNPFIHEYTLYYLSYYGTWWNWEVVDETGQDGLFPSFQGASLALDSNGNPHISYGESGILKYAKRDNTGWAIEVVDSEGSVGYETSIAVDTNDRPCIAYRDTTNDDLKYAEWTGSEWSIEVVDSNGDAGAQPGLVLDSNDIPHIGYSANGNPMYAKSTNQRPSANAGGPYFADEGSVVTFDASLSNDPGGDDLLYRWDLDYDGQWDTEFSELPWATYSWQDEYQGQVAVEVTDGHMSSIEVTEITIANVAPTAQLTNDGPKPVGNPIVISFIDPFDPGNDAILFSFDWESDGIYDIVDQLDLEATHTWYESGTYLVTGRISDEDGGFTEYTTDVWITNVPPMVTPSIDQIIQEGQLLDLTVATFTDAGVFDTHSAIINWGDGSTDDGIVAETDGSGYVTGSHVYGDNGVFTVRVVVTDNHGGVGSCTFLVTVENVEPTIEPFGPFTVTEGEYITFSATATDPGSDDLTFIWEITPKIEFKNIYYANGETPDPYPSPWGDHPISATDSVVCAFGDNDFITMTLTVLDDDGTSVTYSTTVTILNADPVIGDIDPIIMDEGDSTSLIVWFYDTGGQDTFTATINWDDGTVDSAILWWEVGDSPPLARGIIRGGHTYGDNGEYRVVITLYDDDGGSKAKAFAIVVNNIIPTCEPGADVTGDEGSIINLDAATFYDPGFDDTFFALISWGDGDRDDATIEVTIGGDPYGVYGSVSGSHIYDDDGVYSVTVYISDDDGGDIKLNLIITVNNVAPSPSIDSVVQPYAEFIFPDDILEFYGSYTDPGVLDEHFIEWDFGDGTPIVSETLTPTHAYSAPGEYTVILTVADDDRDVGTSSVLIIVSTPEDVTGDIVDDVDDIIIPPGAEVEIGKAITSLNEAIAAFENGDPKTAFSELEKAVRSLMKTQDDGADTQEIIDRILDFLVDLVSHAIQDAIDYAGVDDNNVQRAQESFDAALALIAIGEYDKAVAEMGKAHDDAMKAMGM